MLGARRLPCERTLVEGVVSGVLVLQTASDTNAGLSGACGLRPVAIGWMEWMTCAGVEGLGAISPPTLFQPKYRRHTFQTPTQEKEA